MPLPAALVMAAANFIADLGHTSGLLRFMDGSGSWKFVMALLRVVSPWVPCLGMAGHWHGLDLAAALSKAMLLQILLHVCSVPLGRPPMLSLPTLSTIRRRSHDLSVASCDVALLEMFLQAYSVSLGRMPTTHEQSLTSLT